MKIIFYNNYHRGDLHFSRSFVEHTVLAIVKNYPNTEFLYVHQNSPDTISDIVNVREVSNSEINFPPNNQVSHGIDENGDKVIAINTWVGSNDFFREDCGCCFVGNQKLWSTIWSILDQEHGVVVVPPDNWEDVLPKINYDSYSYCSFIDDHLREINDKYQKKVFVSNGVVLSNQAINFDFDPIIQRASQNHPDCVFYLTDDTGLDAPNIYKTRELIKKDGCDLNENSYLSRSCDVLIGRASGPFAFACCYENFMDKNKTFCIFTNGIGEGAWHTDGKCNYKWCRSENFPEIENIIETSLGE